MIVEEHPTDAQLTAFGLGKLDDAEFSAIEAHVAECETCRHQLETQAADSFVALARAVRLDHTWADAAARPAAPYAPTCALTDTAGPASTEVPQELSDHPRYRILGLIGVGGMGAVFKAEHLLMHRIVALKVINRRLVANPAMVERFTREVIAAGNLSHPNIVHYHDAEHIGDTHFLVMEHVEGTNLAKLMAETGPLPIAQACDFARQAALGLQHAFERGMVHRDIKPQNLMVSGEKGSSLVKILDFGLARLEQETAPTPVEPVAETIADRGKDTPSGTLTQIGTVMGTPDYIAPEQARDAHAADIRSDIYSLGCTLYDLLTGKPPFPTGTVMQKVIAHLERSPRPVTEIRPEVPAELARVVEKMLAKDPAQRYQTPAEVAAALAPFVSEPEASAKSTPARRRPIVFATLALGLLALFAALFVPPVQDFAQTVIRIATNKGVLEIEADDEKLVIEIKQAGKEPLIYLVDKRDKKVLELTATNGLLTIREQGGEMRFTSTSFELSRGGRKVIRAWLLLDEVKTDRELIQGTWKPIRVEVKGMVVPNLVFETLDPHIQITGQQVLWKIGPGTFLPNLEGELQLDPSKSPKTINMLVFDKEKKERKVLLGIYRLEGDTLEICSVLDPNEPANRPKEFKTDAKSFVGHIVLQRVTGQSKAPAVANTPAPTAGFVPLFNGNSLAGWKTLNAESWKVKDGAIIGTRGHLQHERMFGDFHCRLEVKIKGMGDVGFRGILENWVAAPIGNKWLAENTGSLIHSEKGEIQVLVDHKNDLVASDEWFSLEILAQGKAVTVKVNGKTTAQKTIARMLDRGYLDLKVDAPDGKLYVRKIEIKELPASPPPEFQPLFNGKDLTGWVPRITAKDDGAFQLVRFTEWVAENGMVLTPLRATGYLLTDQDYWDYELQLEYKLMDNKSLTGLELAVHKGWKDKLQKLGHEVSLQIDEAGKGKLVLEVVGDESRSQVLGAPAKVNPLRFWNKLKIVAKGEAVQVWLNDHFLGQMANTGLKDGLIALKGNRNDIYFRNIEIRNLDAAPRQPGPAFQPLFNGKDLDGWNTWADAPGGGKDDWIFADNRLTFSKPDQYQHGLWSTKRFKDFELKFQAKLDGSNGEFDFRLRSDPLPDHAIQQPRGITLALRHNIDYWAVVVNGFSRTESKTLAEGIKGNGLINWSGYNDFFVRCIGNRVTVLINGKKVVDQEVDEKLHPGLAQLPLPRSGHLAVHCKPRDAKILIRDLVIRELPPPLADRGFEPLFNGKDLTGWTGASDSYFAKKDGSLQANPVANNYAMLHTIKNYENYELRMLCKVGRAGEAFAKNRGGVALHVTHPEGLSHPEYGIGISLTSGRDPDMKAHGLGDLGEVKSSQGTKGPSGAGSWNELRVVCQGKKVTIYYNGEERWSCTLSPASKGQIGLWSIDGETYFRDIEIKELPPTEPAFKTLFDGKDVSAWDMNLADNWRFEDNRLICRGNGGMLRPKKLDLREFHLRIEARHFGEGAYLRLGPQLFQTPDKKSVTAHQHVLLSPVLISAAGSIGMEFGDEELSGGVAQKDRTKPGEWYTLDVIHEGRYVRTLINGEQAAEFVVTEPGALVGLGLLGFHQEDKHGELQIRKIEIRDLSDDPKTAKKRLQGIWTPTQAIRGAAGKDAAFSKEDLKAFALEFDKGNLKCGLFPDATFQLRAPNRITIRYRGPAQQMVTVEGTYQLTHDILNLYFEDIDLPIGPAAAKDKDGRKPLQIALFRYHSELVPLFNGKNLHGFVNDRENWTWQADTLVGVRRASDNNEDLLFRPSMPNLRDFELEFQVRTQGQAPVGILFRGGENEENVGLLANGPMLSIDGIAPGGLWNRNRDQLWNNPPAEKFKAVKPNAFNHYVLRCVGKRVTVQINGVTMIDDDLDVSKMQPAGKLAWALGDNGKAGTVTFREIRLRVLPPP